MEPFAALEHLWSLAKLPKQSLDQVTLLGQEPVFPTSFSVGTAAQVTIAASALAACDLGELRGSPKQSVSVEMLHAAAECTGWFTLDGKEPVLWDSFAGLYPCAKGYVRIHTNFDHHRHGVLRLLGLNPETATKEAVAKALLGWHSLDFENKAAELGLVVTALRTFEEWDSTEQGQAVAAKPVISITKIGDAAPLPLPALDQSTSPMSGIRVLDLTRILAGPVGGRALASMGADVMLVNSPNLPNIAAIAETSRGKRSVHIDLLTHHGKETLWKLIDSAHVFSQGYRPGGLAKLGFSPENLAARRPGIVVVSLSAYGTSGPWANRRGFDSLIQTAMGFNHAEGVAAGNATPRALPMQILDQASGFLMAFGAAAALLRQQQEGGSWLVEVSLAQTGQWLRSLGRVDNGFSFAKPDITQWLVTEPSGFGLLQAIRPSAQLSRTPAGYDRPSVPPGTDKPEW